MSKRLLPNMIGLSGLFACGLPDVRYETKYLEIAPYFDFPICEGTAALLDEHVETLEGLMGSSIGDKPIRIYWGEEGVSRHCSEGVIGCYKYGKHEAIFIGGYLTAFHELVHAVGHRIEGHPSVPFLEEGIANVLSFRVDLYKGSKQSVSASIDVDYAAYLSSIATSTDVATDVDSGAHFLKFLGTKYGIEKIIQLKASVADRSSRSGTEEAFEAVFGTDLTDELDAWQLESPRIYHAEFVMQAPHLKWESGALEFKADLDCSNVNTMGPLTSIDPDDFGAPTEGMYQTATFDLLQPTKVRAEITGEISVTASIYGTTGCYYNHDASIIKNGKPIEVVLPACRWVLNLSAPHAQTAHASLRLSMME